MIFKTYTSGESAFTRSVPSMSHVCFALVPALTIVLVLFGGGLLLGGLQGLGYFPGAGKEAFTFMHFHHVLADHGFLTSLGLTFYIAFTSTLIAVAISIILALLLMTLSERMRWFHFILQIPLVIPHLVIAIAVIFLVSPAGWLSRIVQAVGLIRTSSEFPLLVNDRLGVGIILAYTWKEIPFITLMIFSILRNAGVGLLEVGRTLNANRWQRFRYILLPMIAPGVLASALIVFAYTFGSFEVPFLLGQTYPMLLPVWAYKNYADVDLMARPEGIAAGLVIAAVVMLSIMLSHLVIRMVRWRGGLS